MFYKFIIYNRLCYCLVLSNCRRLKVTVPPKAALEAMSRTHALASLALALALLPGCQTVSETYDRVVYGTKPAQPPAPLVPIKDPRLAESLRFENV